MSQLKYCKNPKSLGMENIQVLYFLIKSVHEWAVANKEKDKMPNGVHSAFIIPQLQAIGNLYYEGSWQMGNQLRVLSESYTMNTNMTGFRWFSKYFAS